MSNREVMQQALKQPTCIGKDPRCPCQDGDACHYKDCGDSKARQQAEPVAWTGYDLDGMVEAFSRVIEAHYSSKSPFHNPIDTDAKMALRILRGFIPTMKAYATPPQRPWVGLTGEEIDANQTLRYHFSLNNGPVTRAGIAVVETIEAMLKAKNHG